jgi:hypothetical protein
LPTLRQSGSGPLSAATVLSLLFDLAQQAARVGIGPDPWKQLAEYDADAFAAFTTPQGEKV